MTDKPFSLSVKVLIQDPEGRWLLLRRSPGSTWNPGKWDLPGGKVESQERFETALRREVLEETGLEIQLKGLYGAIEDEVNDFRVVHLVLLGYGDTNNVELSGEHDRFEWIDPGSFNNRELCLYLRNLIEKNKGFS